MEFAKVNSSVLNAVLFIQFENTVTIDKDGGVRIDH